MKRGRSASMASTSSASSASSAMDTETSQIPNVYTPRKRRLSTQGKGRKLSKRQRFEVQRIVARNSELKYVNASAGPANCTTTATLNSNFWNVAQGYSDSQRVGDRLEWCGSMELKIQATNGEGATADIYNNIRQIIFQWHPNSTPVAGSILLNGPSGNPDVYSNYSHDNRQQYTVIFDKVYRTVGNGGVASGSYADNMTTGVLHYSIPLKKCQKQVQFAAGSSTVATNMFYQLSVSDSALATHPQITLSIKTFFRDS